MANKLSLQASVDSKDFRRAMRVIGKEALPKAIADTLNRTADAVTKQQIRNVKSDLIVRTQFTMRSMTNNRAKPYQALNKASGTNLERMFSRAGTFSPYLWLQEDDNEVEGLNGPKPIPTLQARTSKSIRRSIRKTYRLSPNQSLRPGSLGDRQFIGSAKGNSRRKGIYERSPSNRKLKMIRNLESEKVKIKGTGFHSKAVAKYGTAQFIRAQFFKRANLQLRKKGVI